MNKQKSYMNRDIIGMMLTIGIFLFALNFLNLSGYIFFGLLYILMLNYFIKNEKIIISNEFLMIILFSLSYFLIYSYHFGFSFKFLVYFLLGPIGSYMIGLNYNITRKRVDNIEFLLLVSVLGMFLHGALNMVLRIKEYGIFSPQRVAIDFWRGDIIAATGQGMYFTMLCGIFFSYVYVKHNRHVIKWIIVLCMVFSLFSTLELANRTFLVIFVVCGMATFALKLYLEKTNIKSKIKFTIDYTLLIFSSIVLYQANIFNIKDYILNSPLTVRIGGEKFLGTSRIDILKDFFSKWMNYPMGGYKLTMLGLFNWTHNLWLDIYCAVGIIPFIFFLFYTYETLKNLTAFIRLKNIITIQNKIMVFGFYVACILNFLVEPILENNPYYFMLFIMINGSINSFVNKYKKGVV